MPAILMLLLILSALPAGAAERALWTIGIENGSSREFGRQVNFADPRDEVVFRVGVSRDPADWPASHPGSSNAGAGARPHTYTIVFNLEDRPAAGYALVAGFIFKRPRFPSLVVDVNGHKGRFYFQPRLTLYIGDDDGNYLPNYAAQKLEVPFPGGWLKPGENRLALTCLDDDSAADRPGNSAVSYDFLRLEPGPAPAPRLEARLEPTIFYPRRLEGLAEIAQLTVSCDRRATGTATIRLAASTLTQQLSSPYDFGEQRYDLLIPELPGKTAAEIVLATTAGTRTIRTEIEPGRKWKIYLAPNMHLDIGYTDYQAKVAELQARNTDVLIELLAKNPEYRYNLDNSWIIEQFLAARSEAQQEAFFELARRGQFGVNAWYLNLLTAAASPEELIRSAFYSYALHKKHGVFYDFANLTDVPSASWSLASFLSAAGIKYFAHGSNQDRGPILIYGGLHQRGPYYWEGPDGKRVLTWYSRHYHQVAALLGLPPSLRAVRDSIPIWLQSFTRPDYAPDAVLIYGTQVENQSVTNEADLPREWNGTWAWPQLIPCRMDEFFAYVERDFGRQLPVVRGDGGGYWEDGLGTMATATALARRTQQRILAAETLTGLMAAINPGLAPPLDELRRAWDQLLLFTEHTITAAGATSQPDAEQSRRQTAVKVSRPSLAAWLVDSSLLRGLSQLGALVDAPARTLLVFNPLSWTRGGLVEVDLDPGQGLRDQATRQDVPYEVIYEKDGYQRVRFYAERVPAVGYKLYALLPAAGSRSPEKRACGSSSSGQPCVVENAFYRLTLDPRRAAVTSLWDKQLQVELVDSRAALALNQFLYVSGGGSAEGRGRGPEATQIVHFNQSLPYARLEGTGATGQGEPQLWITPYGQRLRLAATGPHTPRLETEIVLYDTEKRIDFVNRFHKQYVLAKEAVYFAFPLAVAAPVFRYEIQNGWVNPAQDQLPGASSEWFAVQNWVNVSNGSLSVTFSTPDAPLVTLGDINRGRWPRSFAPAAAAIYSYALNNYWHTNTPAGQGGEFEFRYSLTSARAFDGAAAARFGRGTSMPLEPNLITAADRSALARGALTAPSASLLEVEAPAVVLVTWKRAEDGDGYMARLQETAGAKSAGRLRLPRVEVRRAFRANAVEENGEALAVSAHEVPFSIGPFEVLTLRIVTTR